MKNHRDNINVITTAKEEGREEGKEIGETSKAIEIVKNLLDVLDVETIAVKTGLGVTEVERLRDDGF